ncbi:MAG: GDYXXLXY domain-containing protein, partial [Aeromonas sp.]
MKCTTQQFGVLITGLAILVAINIAVWHHERALSQGEVVLLELAPVDPRSLMQGDYMRLN